MRQVTSNSYSYASNCLINVQGRLEVHMPADVPGWAGGRGRPALLWLCFVTLLGMVTTIRTQPLLGKVAGAPRKASCGHGCSQSVCSLWGWCMCPILDR